MTTQPRSRQLAVFLLKKSITDPVEALKDAEKLEEVALADGHPFTGRLFLNRPSRKPPKWVNFLQEGVATPIDVFNISQSAVLFIKKDRRLFAITFGYGRHLLQPECWEESFGLKVVLNMVDPDRLRSMDLQRFQEMTLNTRRQVSRASDLNAFGIDASQDILKAVTGEPRDSNFAKRVTGADSLVIQTRLLFSDLGTTCARLLEAYQKEDYKEYFSWIDNLGVVKPDSTKNRLNTALVEALQKKHTDKIHFSPPEVIDWQDVEGFRYTNQTDSSHIYPDLDVDTFLSFFDDTSEITFEGLKRLQIEVVSGQNSDVIMRWPVFKCLVFETNLASTKPLYILSAGTWFKADKDYAETVRKAIHTIEVVNLGLPLAGDGESEGDYNDRAANGGSYNCCLMDKKLVRPSGASSPIEFCDLLSKDGDLIHVKRRKGGSSVLSHLFCQGVISAELLKMDSTFRAGVLQHLKEHPEEFHALIHPDTPDTSSLRVVYAVIGRRGKNAPSNLPFFSQLNLVQAARRLQALLGFKVGYAPIDLN